ncbi:MAG: hypothetical protein AMS21_12165 [Gemmatimonas sp. SG8_38_2]|nr:MAG: hypothetical protein AMS21_12165 [Gemmatimonas sp. SG8_38_2]
MRLHALGLLSVVVLTGCATEGPAPSVRIKAPQDDAVVLTTTITVELSAENIDVVPADGAPTPGRVHHHVFFDTDLSPAGQPIPAGAEGIFHLGTGDSTLIIQDLTPGRHRLISVLATGNHVPLIPWVVDTVYFTVDGRAEEN